MKNVGKTWLLAAGLGLLVSGCATMPSRRVSRDIAALMPEDAVVYLRLEPTAENVAVWSALVAGQPAPQADFSALLDRMGTVFAAVTAGAAGSAVPPSGSAESASAALHVAATGRFPSSVIELNLGRTEGWLKRPVPRESRESWRTPRVYWASSELGMEMCLPDRRLLLLSTGGILPLLEAYGEVDGRPVGLPSAMLAGPEDGVPELAVFFPDFQHELIGSVLGNRLPVRSLYVEAWRAGGGVDLTAEFTLEKEESARAFNVALRIVLLYLMKEGELEGGMKRLSTLEVEQDGPVLRLTGLSLTDGEIAAVLSVFLWEKGVGT